MRGVHRVGEIAQGIELQGLQLVGDIESRGRISHRCLVRHAHHLHLLQAQGAGSLDLLLGGGGHAQGTAQPLHAAGREQPPGLAEFVCDLLGKGDVEDFQPALDGTEQGRGLLQEGAVIVLELLQVAGCRIGDVDALEKVGETGIENCFDRLEHVEQLVDAPGEIPVRQIGACRDRNSGKSGRQEQAADKKITPPHRASSSSRVAHRCRQSGRCDAGHRCPNGR